MIYNTGQGLRSLSHLRERPTVRADDSHAVAVLPPSKAIPISRDLQAKCQAQVRFFASFRIKPHAPLVVQVPVNSFEFQPCGRTTQAVRLTR